MAAETPAVATRVVLAKARAAAAEKVAAEKVSYQEKGEKKMAVNLGKIRKEKKKREKSREEREKRRGKGKVNWYATKIGANCVGILYDHPNMDGLPYAERGVHRNCGPESKSQFNCRRMTLDDPAEKCPQCEQNFADWSSSKQSRKDIANKRKRGSRFYYGVIDLIALVLDDEMPKVPKCFIDHPGEENTKAIKKRGCNRCDFKDGCISDIMVMSCGTTIHEAIIGEFEDIGDITDPKAMYPIKFTKKQAKKGDPFSISYEKVKALKKPIVLPDEVIARIEEKLIDLTVVGVPKSIEEIKAIMAGMDLEDAPDDEDSDLPECYGEYKDGKKKCDKCASKEACEVDTEGEEEEEEEEDTKKKKPKKKAAAAKKKEEDEDEDEEEDDEDEDEEEDDEDEEEDDEEEDDEEEEEEEDDEEEEDEEDDDEEEEEEEDDEDEGKKSLEKKLKEKAAAKKKKKTKK